ncbi:hypothetical protein ACFS27_03365 [Promicromonospora vindobonensis]|uniref:Head-to-tail adaptor n=1 Tax=Promicromonospora vindobonensis TaxID=195748 RepID=A0ABW5VQ73_9MICO
MALVYATEADLSAAPWSITPLPANVGRLLAYASRLVRKATRSAVYDTDTTGAPTGTTVVAGFRDAVCAQVAAWSAAGITDPAAEAASTSGGVVTNKSLGPRAVGYAGAEAAAAERARITRGLTDEAAGYIDDLNLPSAPWVIG